MLITNLEYFPGREVVEHYGLVNWSTVRAKHFWKDFMAGLKNIVWWELKWYTELLDESRQEAINRMTKQAEELWANAILNVRFSTSSVSAWASEIYVYGTAVKL